ncbi:DUF3784 domain-containing protein [Bacillus sp. JJ722]|uniref:DUF3784 domain-containing protein n=1 Tax=Bacillus sp. JJ722 TaxID=3122973 RepID=UPI002FFF7F56
MFVGCIVTGLAYLIHNKKEYSLLSGYNSYTDEEKAELERNGYLSYEGKLMWGIAIIWLLSIPVVAFRVPYGIEIFIAIFLLFLMSGTLYGLKYDVKRKRKRNAILLISLYSVILIGIGVLFYLGNKDTNVTITNEAIEMSGMYDDTIAIKDIDELKMIDRLPSDTIKSNGFATETRSLGSFHSKKWGSGRHYAFTKYPPYIWIKTDEKYYILNSKNEQETSKWYQEIMNAWSSQKQFE